MRENPDLLISRAQAHDEVANNSDDRFSHVHRAFAFSFRKKARKMVNNE